LVNIIHDLKLLPQLPAITKDSSLGDLQGLSPTWSDVWKKTDLLNNNWQWRWLWRW